MTKTLSKEQISKIFKRKQIEFSNRKNIIAFSQHNIFSKLLKKQNERQFDQGSP